MKPRDMSDLEQALGYQFSRPKLLEQALTHSSQARELESRKRRRQARVEDNEQLELLGDAVLGLVTTEELFHRFPHFREGELSKLRAHLVSERHLIQVARRLELGHYLRLGRGEEKSGGRNKTALLVDGLEAVLGRHVRGQWTGNGAAHSVAAYRHSGAGKHGAERQQFATERLQVCAARKASGHGPSAGILCVSERARTGAQQDFYG